MTYVWDVSLKVKNLFEILTAMARETMISNDPPKWPFWCHFWFLQMVKLNSQSGGGDGKGACILRLFAIWNTIRSDRVWSIKMYRQTRFGCKIIFHLWCLWCLWYSISTEIALFLQIYWICAYITYISHDIISYP